MPARHPASAPSHLPPRGATSGVAASGLSARARAVAVVLGFLVGAGALVLPFPLNWPSEDAIEGWGIWFALIEAFYALLVIMSVGVPLTVVGARDRRARYVGVGMLLSVAALGCLTWLGMLYLTFW